MPSMISGGVSGGVQMPPMSSGGDVGRVPSPPGLPLTDPPRVTGAYGIPAYDPVFGFASRGGAFDYQIPNTATSTCSECRSGKILMFSFLSLSQQ